MLRCGVTAHVLPPDVGGEGKEMKFELIHKVSKGQFYWRFVASNGRIICWSEYYNNRSDAAASIDLVKKYAATAPIVELQVA
jgi:uncharacterized protein YegP (UPF0339 family)